MVQVLFLTVIIFKTLYSFKWQHTFLISYYKKNIIRSISIKKNQMLDKFFISNNVITVQDKNELEVTEM